MQIEIEEIKKIALKRGDLVFLTLGDAVSPEAVKMVMNMCTELGNKHGVSFILNQKDFITEIKAITKEESKLILMEKDNVHRKP